MVIPIVSLKGGVGKSTVSINLADHLSLHSPTVLIDTDQQNSVAALLCQKIDRGFSELLAGTAEIPEVTFQPFEENQNFFITPTGKFAFEHPIEYEELFEKEKVKKIVEKYLEFFKYIIFDTAPRVSKPVHTLLKICDYFLIVINADPASVASLNIFLKELKENGLTNFSIIVNNFRATEINEDFYSFIQAVTNNNIIGTLPHDISVIEAEAECKTVRLYDPNSAFNLFMKEIAEKIIQK